MPDAIIKISDMNIPIHEAPRGRGDSATLLTEKEKSKTHFVILNKKNTIESKTKSPQYLRPIKHKSLM